MRLRPPYARRVTTSIAAKGRRAVGACGVRYGRMSIRYAIYGAALLEATLAAQAHHSIAAVYDSTRERRIEGVVAEFKFVNPHPFVVVSVEAGGAEEQWR